jgi:hypothetical protein
MLSSHTTGTPSEHRTLANGITAPVLIWRMTSNAHEVRCVAHAGPRGLEVQCILNGSMLSSRRFERPDEALWWTARKQLTLQRRGWERA